jgi:hypothetical protein
VGRVPRKLEVTSLACYISEMVNGWNFVSGASIYVEGIFLFGGHQLQKHDA